MMGRNGAAAEDYRLITAAGPVESLESSSKPGFRMRQDSEGHRAWPVLVNADVDLLYAE